MELYTSNLIVHVPTHFILYAYLMSVSLLTFGNTASYSTFVVEYEIKLSLRIVIRVTELYEYSLPAY